MKPAKNATTPVTVRLSQFDLDRLNELADEFKVTQATVIRWAVDSLIDYVRLHDGRIHLPINLDEQWARIRLSMVRRAAEDPAVYLTEEQRRTAEQLANDAADLLLAAKARERALSE